ncbi:MAG: type II toxin-antitoxin system PemK/MazF family toxin [Candidatus Fermentibacteraceae bacterium]|nr:type II toxin-antitoxin system PemK/MazF family toxin [Candidatus Fermentibacteraceae bacterium]
MEINRFEIFLVNLDPTPGHEIKKTRPCLVISPNEMNHNISTIIIAPMTSQGKNYPTRISCLFKRRKGQIVLDQIRTVDKKRLVKKLGVISKITQTQTINLLQEMFAL